MLVAIFLLMDYNICKVLQNTQKIATGGDPPSQ